MSKPKLTPTFNDKAKAKAANGPELAVAVPEKIKITPPHEPLKGEGFNLPSFPLPQAPAFTFPMPPKAPVIIPPPLKIALVGTAPSSRMLAPFDDPTWQIWGCSPGNMNILKRVDCWFEIHANLLWPEHKHYGEPYVKWLAEQKFPVFMQNKSLIPHAQVFPKNELIKMFGRRCWTSSFAWMLAFAVYKGAKEVNLYGIDMASRDEYMQQRHGFNGLLDRVESMGVKVDAPYESDIMMPPALYGFSEALPFARKMHTRRKEIKDRIGPMEVERQRINDNILYLKGADEDIDYVLSIWAGVQDNIDLATDFTPEEIQLAKKYIEDVRAAKTAVKQA